MKATCSVLVCEEPAYGRGLCKGHHQRLLTKGDPGITPIRKKRPGSKCKIEGCDRPHQSRGWCKPHYRRWLIDGDPGGLDFVVYPVPREELTYHAAHQRITAQRGPASNYGCPCGEPAEQWAYQHNDPDPLATERGYLYSDDVFGCYAPMCVPCHKAFDKAHGQEAPVLDEIASHR